MGNLIVFMRKVADGLQENGNYGTAHVYRSSLGAIIAFNNSEVLPFRKLTPEYVKKFEIHLRKRGCSWNTVSTYIRVLRAVYNRAVDQRIANFVPRLFRNVYTGTRADHKRSMDHTEIAKMLDEKYGTKFLTPSLVRTKKMFLLMFMLRGLPFVDLAYLRKSDLDGDVIAYRRKKTGRALRVTLTPEAKILLNTLRNEDPQSPYLLSLLNSSEGTTKAYYEYQLALRNFNRQLMLLKTMMGLGSNLSSYTARHTWATMAYYSEIHPGIISEAMGHSSITVTETYLKPFRNRKIDEANDQVIAFSKRA